MSLQELKEQARQLSVGDRLELVSMIVESLREIHSQPSEHRQSIQKMKGLLKIDQPAPSDEQIEAMLDERQVDRYLS